MSFWDEITGRSAAEASNAAAADTYGKQQDAIKDLLVYGDDYAKQFSELSQAYNPYITAGGSALERLMAGLGLGGNTQGFTNAYRSTPGYANALETGSRAVTGNAAARGMLKSGSALKALEKFGQNYEDQKSGDYLSRLMGLSGTGQTATGQKIATVGTGLQGQLGTRQSAFGGDMASAGTVGQGMIAGANAQAAGSQNLLNAGLKIGGMLLGGVGGGGGASAFSGGGIPIGATRIAGPGELGFNGWG